MALVLWYGGHLVIQSKMSAGDLTSFILYTLMVSMAVGTLSNLFGDFMKSIGASERVFQLMDRTPKVRFRGGDTPLQFKGLIRYENVFFAYPSRPDVIVLKGVDLECKPGQVVALVGPSGGGKSTMVALLEAFYYPVSGHLTIDGVDIRDLDPEFLHDKVGLVSQEPTLFAASISDNIAYGIKGKKVSIDSIIEAAKHANAHDFITSLPQGYDTLVGERGVRLSGGQKQRVAIARAVLKDPTILLLDEATSALDAESEYLVKKALDELMQHRTTLVIAHRLSTVKNAHKVVVVESGTIAQEGTHEQLMSQPDGVYAKLVQRQLQKD
uniref:ABC protein n=1 Tax=Physarum polycephalum TaxID=5791 RepID=Q9NKY2_PHYPO|nr:ABC protein [Physarum polycephalum]